MDGPRAQLARAFDRLLVGGGTPTGRRAEQVMGRVAYIRRCFMLFVCRQLET